MVKESTKDNFVLVWGISFGVVIGIVITLTIFGIFP